MAQPVLGIPAAARALREVHLAGWSKCRIATPDCARPGEDLAREIARLAPGLQVEYGGAGQCDGLSICGEAIPAKDELEALARSAACTELLAAPAPLSEEAAQNRLVRRGDELLAATAKPSDGMVARLVNRPFSQAVTRTVLRRLGPVEPHCATAATALSAVFMTICLVLIPGRAGLIWGAALFQLTSMIDGIDGEIARATFRASPRGASLDSLVDAGTNVLFFLGLSSNLAAAGDLRSAAIALAGLGGLTLGTVLLGIEGRRRRGVVDFNTVKQLVEPRRSRIMQVLTWLTMRDFYAFAALVLIVLGLAAPAVRAFAVFVMGWLMVVLTKLALPSAPRREVRTVSSDHRTTHPPQRSPGS